MTRILIIENDIFKCKKIINCISQSNLNVKIYSVVYSLEEAVYFLKKTNSRPYNIRYKFNKNKKIKFF